ncbi:MAG: phosphate ABC transporter substrate-binding protein, partial [Burkholderiaceae bacterium]
MKLSTKSLLAAACLVCANFAYAENVIVVSSKSAVASLTKDQVADIYLGNMKEFPGGGQALPLLPSSG